MDLKKLKVKLERKKEIALKNMQILKDLREGNLKQNKNKGILNAKR